MTWRVKIVSADESTTQARALLDSASSTLFNMERLARHLCLMRCNHRVKICGFGATSNQSLSRGVTNFSIAHPDGKGKIVSVETLILSKISSTLPIRPVSLDTRWKHLDGLKLADPGFGSSGNVYLLLGADILSCVVFNGRRFGPSGSLLALNTQLGWVHEGSVHIGHTSPGSTILINATSRPSWRIKVHGSQRILVTLASQSTFEWQECTNRISVKPLVLASGMLKLEIWILISGSRVSSEAAFSLVLMRLTSLGFQGESYSLLDSL